MARQANNQLVNRPAQGGNQIVYSPGQKASTFFTSNGVQNLLLGVFKGDKQKAAIVTASMLSVTTSNENLRNDPEGVFAAFLRGEIGMGLSYVLGDYSVVSYFGKAQFQLNVYGLINLALASGAYVDTDCYDVRAGEYKGLDKRTRNPIIEWMDDGPEREALPIVGYYAFFQLVDRPPYYGRYKAIYWTHDAIMEYADTYSKAFQGKEHANGLKVYKQMVSGQLSPERVAKLRNGSPWFADEKSSAHIAMCYKTMMKQLLKKATAPKSPILREKIEQDDYQERAEEPIVYNDEYTAMARDAALAAQREAPVLEAPAATAPADPAPAVPEAPAEPVSEGRKRGRPAKQTQETPAKAVSPAPAPAPAAQTPPPAEGQVNMMEDFPPEDLEAESGDLFGDYGFEEYD